MAKQFFKHNKKLDKLNVCSPFDKFSDYNKTFHKVDREALLEVMPLSQRLSNYIIPDETTSDQHVLGSIIRSMSGIVRYMTGKPVTIVFSKEEDANSHADYGGTKIQVSLGPMYDHRVPFHSRVNAVFGVTFHEAMHVVETTPGTVRMLISKGLTKSSINGRTGKVKKVPDFSKVNSLFEDNQLLANLFNIVEDRRIEKKGLEFYPGYVFYMDEMRKYGIWQHANRLTDPKYKIDSSNPDEYWAALTLYISYKTYSPELLPLFATKSPKDKQFEALKVKVDKIVGQPDDTFEETYVMAKQLFDLYPQEQQDKNKGMKKSAAAEEGEGQQLGPKDQQGDEEMSGEAKEALKDALAEARKGQTDKKEPIDKVMQCKGDTHFENFGIHPAKKGEFDKKAFDEASEIARSISKNLSFLDSRFNRTSESYELTSGNLDEDELYSLNHNRAIFTEDEEAPGYSMDLCILIDESGSMGCGDRIYQAKVAGLALALALQHNDHINLYVYGHTADHRDSDENVSLYRYLDPQQRATDINTLFSIRSRSNNADGYAIAKMGEILKKGKSKTKVLIVVSDGQPAASCYGDGIGHTRDMVTMLEKKDIFVVQICVDNVSASPKMFKHYVQYNKQKLGMNLRKVLMKKLVEISNQI